MQVSDARIACSTILLGIVGRPSSIGQQRAEHYHQVKAVNLQLNADEGGRIIKCLHVTYKNSRLAMVIPVCRLCKAKGVVAMLEEHIDTDYIQPVSTSPWENEFAGSFNGGGFQHNFLNTELFTTAAKAQILAGR